jgi:hypothetical protein
MMNAFDFWVIYAASAQQRPLLKAGVPASAVVKERVGWSKSYGGRSYPRYRYVANLDYVDAPAGPAARDAALAKWGSKGLDVHARYVVRD